MDTRDTTALLASLHAWEEALARVAAVAEDSVPRTVRLMVQRQGGPYAHRVAQIVVDMPSCSTAHARLHAHQAQRRVHDLLSPFAESLARALRARMPVLTGPNGALRAIWSFRPGATSSLRSHNGPVLAGDALLLNNAFLPIYHTPLRTLFPLLASRLHAFGPTSAATYPSKADGGVAIGAANAQEAIDLVQTLSELSASLLASSLDTQEPTTARSPSPA